MNVNDLDTLVTHTDYWQPKGAIEDVPKLAPVWTYDGGDPAISLFTAAVERFNLTFPMGSRILELGCAETDWLERMHQLDPSFDLVGVDARRHERAGGRGIRILEGSAMDPNLFEDESFDRIVLLGALEHFGLGFYDDPVDEAGDSKTMQNVGRWLRPGGFVYFDVPVQPTYRVAENRHFRMYAPSAHADQHPIDGHTVAFTRCSVRQRLLDGTGLREINRAYSLPEPHAGTWCHEPSEDRVPYWFVAVLAQKVA